MHLWLVAAAAAAAGVKKCGMEGDECSPTRKCCSAHECVEAKRADGKLAFMCQRTGKKPAFEEYVKRLRKFLLKHHPKKLTARSRAEELSVSVWLEQTVERWHGSEERLFHILGEKYKVPNVHDEL